MDIDTLIAKYLSASCTSEETVKLERWRALLPANEDLFRRSEEAWHLVKADSSRVLCDKEKTWRSISERISARYTVSVMMRAVGIAASIALVAGFVLAWLLRGNDSADRQARQLTFTVPRGVCSQLTLPDGTQVWINSASAISYPDIFSKENRTVELVGEAFFEVMPDADRPFTVRSGNLQAEVLGTSFDFRHYPEDTYSVLAVETGKVRLFAPLPSGTAMSAVEISAGNYLLLDNSTAHAEMHKLHANRFSSWRDNKIIFRDESFGNVLNELSRKYNVDFEIRDSEIRDYVYTATFDNMMLEDVMKLLKLSAPIDYTITNLTSNKLNAYGKRKIMIYRK
ncbi:MAG: DUF4974 domain-containing protein [Bacteroidales bacterium]|nr:DUF4974 domain-containing protein [Bacteroidales bacterium]